MPTKAEESLGKAIAKEHYVELSSKAKKGAAEALEDLERIRVYEDEDGKMWAKARTRAALETLKSW